MLPGARLHLQHGPIDLIVQADAEPVTWAAALEAAKARFDTVLEELCAELDGLRTAIGPGAPALRGPVARRMAAAVRPHAAAGFITPMAAVAGAVAEEVLAAMAGVAGLRRGFANNGGDIALYLAPGEQVRIGLVDRPDRPGLFGTAVVAHADPVRGIATSGWRGRSLSLGIADAVTVLAATASVADAAATVIANAVDLPGHPAVTRAPARSVQAESDLSERAVTRAVGPLPPAAIAQALAAGAAVAERLRRSGLIAAAALHCAGVTRVVGTPVLQAEPREAAYA